MAKKTNTSPRPGAANDRQAKIQAAAKSGGGGANKIIVAAVVAVLAIVGVVGYVVWSQVSSEKAITGGGNALPAGASALGSGYPAFQDVTAKPNAPTMDVFEDFQCPACRAFEGAFGSTLESAAKAGDVKVVYHIKNFLDGNLRNDSSTRAGNAAFCAADAGKFQDFHDVIYKNQPAQEGTGWTNAQLKDLAQQAGVTGDALTTWGKCFDLNKYVDYIRSVEDKSTKDGVTGTPTIWLNGQVLDLAKLTDSTGKKYDPAKLTAAIAAATK